MIFAVRASTHRSVMMQIAANIGIGTDQILLEHTFYLGIMLLRLKNCSMGKLNSMRHIDARLVDKVSAAELCNPTEAEERQFLKTLNNVACVEQYDHLNQIMYLHKL